MKRYSRKGANKDDARNSPRLNRNPYPKQRKVHKGQYQLPPFPDLSGIEHLVIDGGSTDNPVSIVKELDPKAVVISEPDEGIPDVFNKGLRLAKGINFKMKEL